MNQIGQLLLILNMPSVLLIYRERNKSIHFSSECHNCILFLQLNFLVNVGVCMCMMSHAVPCASVAMCIAQVGGARGAGVRFCVLLV